MHLLGMLLVGIDPNSIDVDRLRSLKWTDAASMLADPSPPGLEGILSTMSLPMWSSEHYRMLWSLTSCHKAMTVLRHAREVTPQLVGILNELPAPLRVVKVCRHMRRPIEAQVIARMCDTSEKAYLLATSVVASDSLTKFYDKLFYVVRKTDVFPVPPSVDHPDVRPILDLNDLRRTALEFGNCLRVYADQIAAGQIAFYVVQGDEPAVVSVKPLIGGRMVIDDIKGVGNAPVSRATEASIREIFAAYGMVKGADERRRELMEQCLSSLTSASMRADDEIHLACWGFLNELGALAEKQSDKPFE